MKKKYIITSLIIGIIIALFVYANLDFPIFFKSLLNIISIKIVPYLFVVFCIYLVLNWKWYLILKSQKYKIPFFQLLKYRFAGYAISYVTPSAHIGGEPVRAMLLKRHGLDMTKALSIVVIDKSIETTFNLFFGLIGVIILFFNFALPKGAVFIVYSLVLVVILFLTFFYQMFRGKGFFTSAFKFLRLNKIKKFNSKYYHKVFQFENDIILFFKKYKKTFYKATLLCVLAWILMFVEYWLLLSLVGYSGNLLTIFLVICGVAVAYAIPIPAALGSLEATQASIFKVLGLSAATGVALSLVVRLKDTIWAVIGFIYLSIYEIKVKKHLFKK